MGLNVGHPIVTSLEVHELIELLFGVVSGVDLGIRELDGVHVPQGEGEVMGV